jgi:hypothetical protein
MILWFMIYPPPVALVALDIYVAMCPLRSPGTAGTGLYSHPAGPFH